MNRVEPKEKAMASASRTTEDLEADCVLQDSTADGDKESKSSRSFPIVLYVVVLLLAMVVTGFAVWTIMDSRTDDAISVRDAGTDNGQSPLPSLEISTDFPLGLCQGDCDTSDHCAEGLICFQREAGDHVPGCAGGLDDDSRTDYCITMQNPSLTLSSEFPLGLCQGDCDKSSDCAEGLLCFHRNEGEEVPGCDGGTKDVSKNDFCVSEEQVPSLYLEQLGQRILGSPDDNLGSSISLSRDGTVLAVGAVDAGSTGYVNIYELIDGVSWKFTTTLTGDEIGGEFGHAVSLSGDGKFLAVGSPKTSEGTIRKVGKVQVYELLLDNINNKSTLVGNDIVTDNPNLGNFIGFQFGYSVSLSEDGTSVAVGEPISGRVTVYQKEGDQWRKVGATIQLSDGAALSISLSSDGTTVAIADGFYPGATGPVRVFKFDGADWGQNGQELGESTIEGQIASVSMSGDGTIVAVADAGWIRLYCQYPGKPGWESLGEPIQGEGSIEHTSFGMAPTVSLSNNGQVFAVGEYLDEGVGRVRLFHYDEDEEDWKQIGDSIQGTLESQRFGASLAVASEGSGKIKLAVGSPHATHSLGKPGFAIVYKSQLGSAPSSTADPTSSPTISMPVLKKMRSWNGSQGEVAGNAVSMSKDGRVFAYGVSAYGDSEGYVQSFTLNTVTNRWQQLERLIREEDGASFGHSIALSKNGTIMAVGIPNRIDGGAVRIFELDSVTRSWNQMAATLVGFSAGDGFGHSVSLSEDGTVVAIGSPNAYDYTSVFRLRAGQFTLLGSSFRFGEDTYGLEGWSVSLSSSGRVVAVGAPRNEQVADEAGAGRVYELLDGAWQQRGQSLLGEGRHDLCGASISLSGDGNTVAIGSINNDNENGENAGYVRIYQYDASTTMWIRLGKPILGEGEGDRSGVSVSLSDDGRKVAIGANRAGETGQVRLFEYDEDSTYWRQIGAAIAGEATGSGFGASVSLVDVSGRLKLAVGAPDTLQETNLGLAQVRTGETFVFEEIR